MDSDKHLYSQPPLWQRFIGETACRTCGQERGSSVHLRDLEPLIQQVRAAAVAKRDSMAHTVLSVSELQQRVAQFCHQHGASFTWLKHPGDREYLTIGYSDFISSLRSDYTHFFRSQEEFADCDDHYRAVMVWGVWLGLTAQVYVHDLDVRIPDRFERPASHVYNLILLEGRAVLFDGGSGQIVQPGTQPKWPFKHLELMA